MENEKVIVRVRAAEQQTLVKRYTEKAILFIRNNKERNFFLYLPHNAVHFPLYPGKEFQGKSANGNYGDWVEEVDWSVGQILDALRELKLGAKTLVLFTSDNGGTPRAVNAPLRGYKDSTWEGGMREPTIAWWPGKIPAGTATGEIAGMMDVLPTLVRLAGGTRACRPEDRRRRHLAAPFRPGRCEVLARRLLLLPGPETRSHTQRRLEVAPIIRVRATNSGGIPGGQVRWPGRGW